MRTLGDNLDAGRKHGQPSAYFGEGENWLLALAVHRDSDSIDRSNFAVLLEWLGGECGTVSVERFNHWAVGWMDYLLIDPADSERVAIANQARESVEDYPVLDESHLSNLEWNEFWKWAEAELQHFDNWADAVQEAIEESSDGPGYESAEWGIIEAARNALEMAENGGFDENGYDAEGYDRNGVNEHGFQRDGSMAMDWHPTL